MLMKILNSFNLRFIQIKTVYQPLIQKCNLSTSPSANTSKPIYLDAQATTQIDPRVLDKMLPYMMSKFGNASSRTHEYGWDSEKAVQDARKHVADLIGANEKEIIFTSGATESGNIAIKGIANFYEHKNHIITSQIEHKCILDSCRFLENKGFKVTYLPVDQNGLVDLQKLEESINDKTALVSIMAVNSEIGVLQDLKTIGSICRKKKVFFHSDIAQCCGKLPLNVNDINADLLSISGHKMYAPKGIGALYVRRKPRVRLEAIQSGGGQERGIRSGTLPTHLIVGIGEAARICSIEMKRDLEHVKKLSNVLISTIMDNCDDIIHNGHPTQNYPGCVNLSFSYVEGESLLMALKDIALSSGSACTSESLEPSYVLRAIGSQEDLAHSSIRFGIGRFTSEEEIIFTAKKCIESVKKLRELSPLWEMVQEGIDIKTIKWTHH